MKLSLVIGEILKFNEQLKSIGCLLHNAYNESFNIKVARFGDNMRNVAVTEGDKIEAQIQYRLDS
jgi:L-arabinose isomerase